MTPLSREQVRTVDRLAIRELGIPGVVLMENAGRNACDLIQKFMKNRGVKPASAVIYCGGGNNGGDGFVSARHLHNRGMSVQVIAIKPIEQLTGDAAIHAGLCQKMGMDIQPVPGNTPGGGSLQQAVLAWAQADLLVDAILGTGFIGNLREDLRAVVRAVNEAKDAPNGPTVAAIDLPSGLDCDTGQPTGHPAQDAIRADLTITFVAPKLGFANPAAKPYLGQVVVADIGTPPGLIDRVCSI